MGEIRAGGARDLEELENTQACCRYVLKLTEYYLLRDRVTSGTREKSAMCFKKGW